MDKKELNNELYKKAMDQIHAPEDLKQRTIEEIQNRDIRRFLKTNAMRYVTACALLLMAIGIGVYYQPETQNSYSSKESSDLYALDEPTKTDFSETEISESDKLIPIEQTDLNTFKDIEELKNILKENNSYRSITKNAGDLFMTDAVSSAQAEGATNAEQSSDYSTTNVQVQGVDEADVVKTDGKYIYYIRANVLHIINAESLEEIFVLDYRKNSNSTEDFNPREMYLVNDKLVLVGEVYSYNISKQTNSIMRSDTYYGSSKRFAQAVIYDISEPSNLIELRKIKVDGSYTTSRMIGDNLYFISNKTPYYYDEIKNEEILPCYIDSREVSEQYVPVNKIVYFRDTDSYNYVIVAGLNISKNEEVSISSFFGARSNMIYASQENLYIPIIRSYYYSDITENDIYKFSLSKGKVGFVAKGSFEGYLDSQFSIDEYNGFLRIATTLGYDENSKNMLYIFDKDLNEVSKLDNLAKGERIYSVRFMGKVGYIVTFEQVDPLFVIDLSDPYKPTIKGELKIPGYSSYLHPYDETHIIGIGYNVKDNGYGGVKNTNMKMSMFDVSDLENPKEMFNVNIGEGYVHSELMNNHKALFYSKEKDLIGFTFQSRGEEYNSSKNVFAVYDIDLERGFLVHGEISNKQNYQTNIQRAIYIGNNLYTLSGSGIIKYDLETFEKLSGMSF